ncbi:unnamed protein product [Discosporangium mesarthrocarpum]
MDGFALEGLRTLMVAMRTMPQEEFIAWEKVGLLVGNLSP